MDFYIAKLVFLIEVLNENIKDQYEEKLIGLNAASQEQAYIKCVGLASKDEAEFINENRHHIRWKLLGITYLSRIDDLNAQAELFSEIRSFTEADLSCQLRRAENIKRQFTAVPG